MCGWVDPKWCPNTLFVRFSIFTTECRRKTSARRLQNVHFNNVLNEKKQVYILRWTVLFLNELHTQTHILIPFIRTNALAKEKKKKKKKTQITLYKMQTISEAWMWTITTTAVCMPMHRITICVDIRLFLATETHQVITNKDISISTNGSLALPI